MVLAESVPVKWSESTEAAEVPDWVANDPVAQEYATFFACLHWEQVRERSEQGCQSGQRPHPERAYIGALLVMIVEGKVYFTHLRKFLLQPPALVWVLGFRRVPDPRSPWGFDVKRTVPTARHLGRKLRRLAPATLRALLAGTVADLAHEIPGLGETISIDVKHIYAYVKENNPKQYVKERYNPERQPQGDPDCRLGVKRSSNQETPDGPSSERKEYVWGYGSGIVVTKSDWGEAVVAELTLPFNEKDLVYYSPLRQQTITPLGFHPKNLAAEAAFDAWYVYEPFAQQGGLAAIPLNTRGHDLTPFGPSGFPFALCPAQREMRLSYRFHHTHGYEAQRLLCPLLYPTPTGEPCPIPHEQFLKGVGCVKDINVSLGGQMRLTLDRHSDAYHVIYDQRTASERLFSQAKEHGIERPRVRNGQSVCNRNTLIYIVLNVKLLQRVRRAKARAPT
jgi:hypothetical protein